MLVASAVRNFTHPLGEARHKRSAPEMMVHSQSLVSARLAEGSVSCSLQFYRPSYRCGQTKVTARESKNAMLNTASVFGQHGTRILARAASRSTISTTTTSGESIGSGTREGHTSDSHTYISLSLCMGNDFSCENPESSRTPVAQLWPCEYSHGVARFG